MSSNPVTPTDDVLLDRIRGGEEAAFGLLIRRYYAPMLRLAQSLLRNQASAEEVVQETWLGVLQGLETFEGRSALKTWMYRILVNRCLTRREKEGRSLPFSALDGLDDEPAVEPARFKGPGFWGRPPRDWDADSPETLLLRREVMQRLERALEELPERQRVVVTLRDLEGLDSEEVCNVLGLSESNQRVLLHRGRSKLRNLLEATLSEHDL